MIFTYMCCIFIAECDDHIIKNTILIVFLVVLCTYNYIVFIGLVVIFTYMSCISRAG